MPTASPAPAAVALAPINKPLKIVFVYAGLVGDVGQMHAHDDGRKEVEAKFGDKVKASFVESVPESAADTEHVFRDLATQDNRVILGTSFGPMGSMPKVTEKFPDVKFEHATSFRTADNLGQYDVCTYESAHLAGVVADRMSKPGKLGVVGSVPTPEVIRNIDSFMLGARSVNPKAPTRVVQVNKWFDPGKECEATTTLIGRGVDVLMQNTDPAAVVQTAQGKGVYAIGWDSDMTKFGEKAHLVASINKWGAYYTKIIGGVFENKWKPETMWWDPKEGTIDLGTCNVVVSEDMKMLVETRRRGITDGSASIWKGPLKDNTGKGVLPVDRVADGGFLHGIKLYAKGAEGKIPGQVVPVSAKAGVS